MTFKIGDFAVHKEHPKNLTVLPITNQQEKEIINAQVENFQHATEKEIEDYYMEMEVG